MPALPSTSDPAPSSAAVAGDHNEVELTGRVSGEPHRRVLPSGDELVSVRLVVRRPGNGQDTLPVQVGPAPPAGTRPRPGQVGRRLLAVAERLGDGQRVAVGGQLRRRWWEAGGARRSRIEVTADRIEPLG